MFKGPFLPTAALNGRQDGTSAGCCTCRVRTRSTGKPRASGTFLHQKTARRPSVSSVSEGAHSPGPGPAVSCRENDPLLRHGDTLCLCLWGWPWSPPCQVLAFHSLFCFVLLCLESGRDKRRPQNSPRSLLTRPATFAAWPFVLVWPS